MDIILDLTCEKQLSGLEGPLRLLLISLIAALKVILVPTFKWFDVLFTPFIANFYTDVDRTLKSTLI